MPGASANDLKILFLNLHILKHESLEGGEYFFLFAFNA